MTRIERITKKIQADKRLFKYLSSYDNNFDIEYFIAHGDRWIKTIKDHRMICSIPHVSKSGMSRHLKFIEVSKGRGRYNMLNFWNFMGALGFEKVRDSNCFRIHGVGMDMVFDSNYYVIRYLYGLGFMSLKKCEHLEQQTPYVI